MKMSIKPMPNGHPASMGTIQEERDWKDELQFIGDVEIRANIADGVARQRGTQRAVDDCYDSSE